VLIGSDKTAFADIKNFKGNLFDIYDRVMDFL
jgi:predicted HTH transcriptional regulator